MNNCTGFTGKTLGVIYSPGNDGILEWRQGKGRYYFGQTPQIASTLWKAALSTSG